MPKKAGSILYVTGHEAADAVRKYARGENVKVMPIDVAALLSKTIVEKELSRRNLKGFDLIVLPGGISGDYASVGKKLGVQVVKGPKQAADIPVFLRHLEEVEYSTSKPADEILEKEIAREVGKILDAARKKKTSFAIGRKNPVYLGEFPHVVAEINDAPKLKDNEISAKAKYFVESGAAIIDLGFVASENNAEETGRLVSAVRKAVDVPVSVDTLNEEEILAGVDAGADLVLSLCADNIELAESINVPFVVVPKKSGRLPAKADERVGILKELIERVGGKNVIADPVLNPIGLGFSESIKACMLLGDAKPKIPLFFGAGNVTEMLDADSHGVNAMLAGVATEIGADLIFSVEGSNKTKGAVKELSTAAKMAYLAKTRGQPMKDLGIDLLFLKDKREIDVIEDKRAGGLFEYVGSVKAEKLDTTSFRVYLKDNLIRVVYYEKNKPARAWKGGSSEKISRKIVGEIKISQAHAAYLGRELAKAEIALKLGKNYVQDEPLF